MSTTMVRLESRTKSELGGFRNFEGESYSRVIRRLINIAKEDDALTAAEIRQIEKSLSDIKNGRVLSLQEAEKQWGV